MSRVLITPRSLTASPGTLLQPLEAGGYELVFSPPGRQPSEAELIRLVPGCFGWIAGVEPITARVFAAADRLRAISRNGTGVDSIDLEAAARSGVKVLIAEGANARAVAELTIAFILAGLRHVGESAAALKAGRWHRVEGREIGGATIGILGCGAVGSEVALMAGTLGAEVIACDTVPRADFRPTRHFAWVGFDELLSRSDVLTLHRPGVPGGAPVLDRDTLGRLKPGAGLVNTARASLVDEDALLAALEEGRVGWFATDVFATEPPPPSPLLAHPRVIATPHVGGFTAEGGRAAVRAAVTNLIGALAQQAPNLALGAEAG